MFRRVLPFSPWRKNPPKVRSTGEGDYSIKNDDKGDACYSVTIGSADLSKWQMIELAYHPSGDAKNMKELMNTALIGKLRK